jgi:hypothetical protein
VDTKIIALDYEVTGNMDCAQEEKHLAETERHIAEAKTLISRQRAVLARARGLGNGLEAQATLGALESSLRTFEKHRERLLTESARAPKRTRRSITQELSHRDA